MRISFLVFDIDAMGGTERSAVTQANALAPDHDVTILSVVRSADATHYAVDPRVRVEHVVDVRDEAVPALLVAGAAAADAAGLLGRDSVLVPSRWDRQFSALTDVGLQAALPRVEADVLVTVTPGLLAAAVQLLPPRVVVVHQEHRSSSQRTDGMEPLLAFAPRADVVSVLTPTIADWLRDRLGATAPEIVVVPNPLPQGFTPRATLESRTIVSAGRLVREKQFPKLVQAFGEIADLLPEWRLRILGSGHQRLELVRLIRKLDLWDRVELPGATTDMASEWAKASICALTSRSEGYPLVLQEAMAAGVPCVSFDCATGPREIVVPEENGLLVQPESISGMAAALHRVATDHELRHRLGVGALRTAHQWDAQALAERWLRIFTDARARRGGRPRLASPAPPPPRRRGGRPDVDITGITPARARHDALGWAVECARRTTDDWMVIPAHERRAHILAVPMEARERFLAALGAPEGPSYLALRDPAANGWHERRGTLAELGADLARGRTAVVAIEPWPRDATGPSVIGARCFVEVEFWEGSVGGELVAPRPNRYVQRIARGFETVDHEVEGVTVRTLELMAQPTVNECSFPIDVVYTWVDGADPAWNAAREDRLAALTGAARSTAQTRESSGQARFLSRDELRYSMRSVHLFAPWVRHVYLVTAGQVPPWLDTDHPGVTVVDHREILPADALPTFNSHAIETGLHRIPGLAEHFIYFNDDFFLGRPLRPEAFFTPSGLSATFLARHAIGLTDNPDAPPFLKAAWNNRRLLQEAFGVVTTNNLAHVPYPHRRSVLEEIEQRFGDVVGATARSPFRSGTDISMLSSFAQHYALMTGRAWLGEADHVFVNISSSDLEFQLRPVRKREQDFICLADHHDHAIVAAHLDQTLQEFMQVYWPVAAPWERDPA
ncbi:stealth conserved region 3 domain-containing protein [Nocardioides sp. SYSU D00038]|uniref:stealth conserved region 3 domain-containing protein n=1 Tax=Nocardioides sp. SYSU D00038 TaxID=2812554 RepID=UPI0019676EEF|nr:stealth conserved region 3 domain-containing protein [Nocardioides sp. SYSU D00038]